MLCTSLFRKKEEMDSLEKNSLAVEGPESQGRRVMESSSPQDSTGESFSPTLTPPVFNNKIK
jgi:hypothetical protein